MAPDPAGQFFSPYVGMGNDWVNSIDPDGRFKWRKNDGSIVAEPGDDAGHLQMFMSDHGIDMTYEEANNLFMEAFDGKFEYIGASNGGHFIDYRLLAKYGYGYEFNALAQSVTRAMDKAGKGVFMGGVIIGGFMLAPEAFLLRSIADFSVQMAFNDFNVQESVTDMNWMSISSAGLGYVPGSIIGAGFSASGNGFSSVLDGGISAKQFGVNVTSNLAFRGAAKLYKPILQSAGTPTVITEGSIFMIRVANGTVKRGVRELNGN